MDDLDQEMSFELEQETEMQAPKPAQVKREPDELDELIDETLASQDDDFDDDDSGDPENLSKSESEEDSQEAQGQLSHSEKDKLSKGAKWRRNLARKREQAEAQAKEAQQQAHQEREARYAAEKHAAALEKQVETFLRMAGIDQTVDQYQIPATGANGGANPASYTPEEVEKLVENKLKTFLETQQGAQRVEIEINDIKNALDKEFARVHKNVPHVAKWFDSFTNDVRVNEQKRELLMAISAFPKAPEALHAASKLNGFDRLPLGRKIARVHEASQRILSLESNRNNKRNYSDEEPDLLDLPTSGSRETKKRSIVERVKTQEGFQDAFEEFWRQR